MPIGIGSSGRDNWGAWYDDEGTQKRLEGFAEEMIDLRPLWSKVVPLARGWMRRQFATEGAWWLGAPWAPLSPRYAAWKAIHYPGRGILVAEGDLRRGSTEFTERQQIRTPRSLTLIVEWPKAPTKHTAEFNPDWHHTGTATIPARPLLMEDWLPPDARVELDAMVDEYVEEAAKRWGF